MKADYIAKERVARTRKKSILKEYLAWGISIAYIAYTFCSIITALNEKPVSDEAFYGLFLMLPLMFAVPLAFLYVSLPHESIEKEIEDARKFLEEMGQESSNENINILLDRYCKGEWQEIEDMLREIKEKFPIENAELVSGNVNKKNVNQNLKEALPAKQD